MNELISLEKIAQWRKLKTLVLDSVSSPITKRVYNMALDEFFEWYDQEPRPGFSKATVSAWRASSIRFRPFDLARPSAIAKLKPLLNKVLKRPVELGFNHRFADPGSTQGATYKLCLDRKHSFQQGQHRFGEHGTQLSRRPGQHH